jgi:hypothetical protein
MAEAGTLRQIATIRVGVAQIRTSHPMCSSPIRADTLTGLMPERLVLQPFPQSDSSRDVHDR